MYLGDSDLWNSPKLWIWISRDDMRSLRNLTPRSFHRGLPSEHYVGISEKENIVFLLVSLEDPAYSKEHQRRRVTFGLNGRLFVRSFGFYLRAVSTRLTGSLSG